MVASCTNETALIANCISEMSWIQVKTVSELQSHDKVQQLSLFN